MRVTKRAKIVTGGSRDSAVRISTSTAPEPFGKKGTVITLRFQTYRRFMVLHGVLIVLSFALGIYFQTRWGSFFADALFWMTLVLGICASLAVGILRKLGRLEFSYSEADRNSYLYNAERQYGQMKARKRRGREGG